ncbi:hypothetical protein J8TS2_19560 [Lederbergia ruris]|uniref:Uncharacterized protein n=1 Tax=Lederbergia ruris TaxID=217495 RepID=A0ABQ4KIC3_9BACI|nr:hypothetical protein J8TS2_19560 [Lederbergia ruris]
MSFIITTFHSIFQSENSSLDPCRNLRYDFTLNGYSYPEMVEGTGPVKPSNLLRIN